MTKRGFAKPVGRPPALGRVPKPLCGRAQRAAFYLLAFARRTLDPQTGHNRLAYRKAVILEELTQAANGDQVLSENDLEELMRRRVLVHVDFHTAGRLYCFYSRALQFDWSAEYLHRLIDSASDSAASPQGGYDYQLIHNLMVEASDDPEYQQVLHRLLAKIARTPGEGTRFLDAVYGQPERLRDGLEFLESAHDLGAAEAAELEARWRAGDPLPPLKGRRMAERDKAMLKQRLARLILSELQRLWNQLSVGRGQDMPTSLTLPSAGEPDAYRQQMITCTDGMGWWYYLARHLMQSDSLSRDDALNSETIPCLIGPGQDRDDLVSIISQRPNLNSPAGWQGELGLAGVLHIIRAGAALDGSSRAVATAVVLALDNYYDFLEPEREYTPLGAFVRGIARQDDVSLPHRDTLNRIIVRYHL